MSSRLGCATSCNRSWRDDKPVRRRRGKTDAGRGRGRSRGQHEFDLGQSPARRPPARRQRVLRRGRVCAGEEPRLSRQGDGRAEQVRRASAAEHDGQYRGLSRLLPARHHHGLARPRLGRRADRVGDTEPAAAAARHVGTHAALHLVPGRLPDVLLAAHRDRRAGAEDALRSGSRRRCRNGSPIRCICPTSCSIR